MLVLIGTTFVFAGVAGAAGVAPYATLIGAVCVGPTAAAITRWAIRNRIEPQAPEREDREATHSFLALRRRVLGRD